MSFPERYMDEAELLRARGETARAKAEARAEAREERLKVQWRMKEHAEAIEKEQRDRRIREHHEKRLNEIESMNQIRYEQLEKQRAYKEEHKRMVIDSLGDPIVPHKWGETIDETISRATSRRSTRSSQRKSEESTERQSTTPIYHHTPRHHAAPHHHHK